MGLSSGNSKSRVHPRCTSALIPPLYSQPVKILHGAVNHLGEKKKSTKYNACHYNTLIFSAAKLLFIVVYVRLIFWELFLKNTKLQWHCAALQTHFGS